MATGAVPARLSLAGCAFSDADKLEYEPDTDLVRARLKYLLVESDDFANLDDWTQFDTGGNITLAGGVVSMNGSNAFDVNGIVRTAGVTRANGYFEVKFRCASTIRWAAMNTAASAVLDYVYRLGLLPDSVSQVRVYTSALQAAQIQFSADTWYTFRLYVLLGEGSWQLGRATIQGGAFTEETIIYQGEMIYGQPATIHSGLQRHTTDAALAEWKEWRWYSGYATDNPTVTLADVDSGADDSEWDMSTIDFAGDTTNLTYKYAYGNTASPTNWSAALSLANLKLEANPTGRYFRLQIIVASDGDTQQEITEGTINCAVATSSATVPAPPAIVAAVTDAGGIDVSFSGTTAGATNNLKYQPKDAGAIQGGGSHSGDGVISIAASALEAGMEYEVVGYSTKSEYNSTPTVIRRVKITVTGQSEPEYAILSLILDDVDVTALISGRAFPNTAPPSAARPFVVYRKTDGVPDQQLLNASDLGRAYVDVDSVAEKYTDAKDLARKIKAALNGYQGDVTDSNGNVLERASITLSNELDDWQEPRAGRNRGIPRISQSYQVTYKETVPTH